MGQETTIETTDVELSDGREPASSGQQAALAGRLCRCGCGEAIRDGSRPTKKYLNRWHKDRHRSRRERGTQGLLRGLKDQRPLWEAWGKMMGWIE